MKRAKKYISILAIMNYQNWMDASPPPTKYSFALICAANPFFYRFEDMSKIDPIVYQPFGAGPRICIGQRFAILEIKMAICKLLMNFELSTCEDTPVRVIANFHFSTCFDFVFAVMIVEL